MKMKNRFFAAVMVVCTFCGCQEREKEAPAAPERTVRFHVRSIETKSAFGTPDGNTYPAFWTDSDKSVGISLNFGAAQKAAITPSEDYRSAAFEAVFAPGGDAPYTFYAISPATAAATMSPSRHGWTVSIPTTQTPLAGSVEESSQILVAASAGSAEFPEETDLSFHHLTAYGRVRLSGAASLRINKVNFVFGTPVVGEWYYACADGAMTPKAASSTITVLTDGTGDIWIACAPADLSGTVLKVIAYTDEDKAYTKTVTFPAGRQLASGRIASFTIDMADAVQESVPVYAWRLLENAGDLAVGDRIVITNSDGDYAVSTTQNTHNRGAAAITVEDGILAEPASNVEILTLAAGSSNGFFALKTQDGMYLASTSFSNKNYLHSNTSVDDYASWTISVSSGIASIVARSGSRNKLLFNPNNGSPIFSCYRALSTQTRNVRVFRYASDVEEAGAPVVEDPLLDKEEYGAYLNGTDYVFDAARDQIRRTYGTDTQSFTILTPDKTVLEVSGIPIDIRQGSSFTVKALRTVGKVEYLNKSFRVTVLRESGPRFWLSDGKGNGFIIKK